MPITILISQHKDCRRVAHLREDELIDVDLEWFPAKSPQVCSLDQIFWGRVLRVDKSHAFISLSKSTIGLLPLEHPFPNLTEGQAILVQVKREPIPDKGTKEKGPLLTRKVTFGGRYCLFHPFHKKRLISSKVHDPVIRNRLHNLIPSDEPFTLRESASRALPDQIVSEMALLREKFIQIEPLADKAPCITPYDSLPSSHRWMRDLDASEGNKILVDSDQALKDIRHFLKIHRPDLMEYVTKHKGSLFKDFGLEDFWDSLFEDVVALPSSGNIVIDITAAAIVIDVNQGDKDSRGTNLEAIPVIVKQLKGRHIGGNIIIDFMGLETTFQERNQLKDQLLKEADNLNLPLDVFGWSKLGWMEARLPKRRLPLWDKL